MLNWTVQDVYDLLDIASNQDLDRKITKVVIDSREVEDDCLFIPIIGERFDGHDFVKEIKDKKFVTLWQEDHLNKPSVPYILVKDTKQALGQLAKAYLQRIKAKVIALTGSNGKTSTKDMIYSLLNGSYRVAKTPGNRNNEIGLPLSILDFDEDLDYVVLEMGMEKSGEINDLCQIARPDIAMVVSIGSAHLENFKNQEGIVQAKLEILDNLKEGGLFLYDASCPILKEALNKRDLTSYHLVGINDEVKVLGDINYLKDGMSFKTNLFSAPLKLNSVGEFQAHNALFALYIAKYLNIAVAEIQKRLAQIDFTKMRLDIYNLAKMTIFDDTYKSNPESCKAALKTLSQLPAKKHIAVLSDMLDLGAETKQLHRAIGLYAERLNIDALYAIGPLSKNTYEAFSKEKYYFEDKKELARSLTKYYDQDVAILFKGSRAMKMEEIIAILKEIYYEKV